ncbi:MAG: ribosomal protein S18 acetylase RimI-like enzyme [Granulosicoccus sp.]|jgi:ribosomal protein S18 acetylase RimI-like enzyme
MKLKIENHSDNELIQVAKIHSNQLNLGFLASLGEKTLVLMYKSIDRWSDSCLITSSNNGIVTGFVSGTVSVGGLYKQFLRRDLLRWVWILLPKLSPKNIWRILELLMYPSKEDKTAQFPKPELLTLAVTDDVRGKGVANALYDELSKYFRTKRVRGFRIMVGDELERAKGFYMKMGAEKKSKIQVHGSLDSWIFVQWLG